MSMLNPEPGGLDKTVYMKQSGSMKNSTNSVIMLLYFRIRNETTKSILFMWNSRNITLNQLQG